MTSPPRSRYPAHLSRCNDKLHIYETLEDLLTEAGYKETRIFTPEAPDRAAAASTSKLNVGGAVVKLWSTWMSREPSASDTPTARPLRHAMSAPHIPRHRQVPPSPSWLTSLFVPRTPPSTPSRRRPTAPRLLSNPRVTSSHVVVTRTNVVCRPTPVRATSSSSTSTRSTGKTRSSSRNRGPVPSLLCQSHHDGTSPPESDDDDDSDDEDELDLTRILIPAKRQHSIRSLRTVLFHNPPRPGTPTRRTSSLNPSRDRSRADENRDPHATPRRPYLPHQSSLPVRISREPLYEEPANMAETEGGGEFIAARLKRHHRGGLPRAWGR